MQKVLDEIAVNYTDPEIKEMIAALGDGSSTTTKHYNQNEDFFLKLDREFTVPSFPIHHDVRLSRPSDDYLKSLKTTLSTVMPMAPQVFRGLTYFFDPSEILRPGFFQLFRMGEAHYLYVVRMDLALRTHDHTVTEKSTNDWTAGYSSKKLFLDADIVPLGGVNTDGGKILGFRVNQTISQTWIGETGRGYFVQGIWMDHELTKFFSKLFLPESKRAYPYYPFRCKYRTICNTVIDFGPEERKRHPPLLHRALSFVAPEMESIQSCLRNNEFSTELPEFVDLKRKVPEFWNGMWDSLKLKPYLNENDMKEYLVEI